MSKIGKNPVILPEGVTASVDGYEIDIKGPKGSLSLEFDNAVSVELKDKTVLVKKIQNSKKAMAIWGLTRALIANMVLGVTQGFEKQLELQGVGFRMAIKGKQLDLALGFSHPVRVDIPEGIEVSIEKNILTIKGIDKNQVGQFAANIRDLKKVEPYKGKGFRYVGEIVRRKEGKKAVASE